jgi:hypothetical protein
MRWPWIFACKIELDRSVRINMLLRDGQVNAKLNGAAHQNSGGSVTDT